MPSNNNNWIVLAALGLTACGGGRSLPPAPQAGYPQQYPQQYPQGQGPAVPDFPMSTDPRYAGPGASYPAPSQAYPPARDLGAQDAYQAQPTYDPAPAVPAGGYPPTSYPGAGASYPPPASGYPPAPSPARPGSSTQAYPPQGYPPAASPQPSYPQAQGTPGGQLPVEQRYDQVGYAGWAAQAGTVAAAHRSLPPGAFVEVTALDSGRTILVPITARAQSTREIELSGSAAQLLGLQGSGPAPVRVRRVLPTAADQNRLRAGQPAEPRYDTPPVLLRALRSRLAGTQGAAPAPAPTAPGASYPAPGAGYPAPGAGYPPPGTGYRPPARPTPPVRSVPQGPGYYVQLAALSNNANAVRLAREAGAVVRQGRGLFLVRAGPFADLRTAQAARDDFAGRGYADARIVRE